MDFVASRAQVKQRTGHHELDVVRMSGDGENAARHDVSNSK
jgi:hypothetical protein